MSKRKNYIKESEPTLCCKMCGYVWIPEGYITAEYHPLDEAERDNDHNGYCTPTVYLSACPNCDIIQIVRI